MTDFHTPWNVGTMQGLDSLIIFADKSGYNIQYGGYFSYWSIISSYCECLNSGTKTDLLETLNVCGTEDS